MTKDYILFGAVVNTQTLLNNTELRPAGLRQVPNPCQEKSSVWGWSAEARSWGIVNEAGSWEMARNFLRRRNLCFVFQQSLGFVIAHTLHQKYLVSFWIIVLFWNFSRLPPFIKCLWFLSTGGKEMWACVWQEQSRSRNKILCYFRIGLPCSKMSFIIIYLFQITHQVVRRIKWHDDTKMTSLSLKQLKISGHHINVIWLLQFLCGISKIFIAIIIQCLEHSKHSNIDWNNMNF